MGSVSRNQALFGVTVSFLFLAGSICLASSQGFDDVGLGSLKNTEALPADIALPLEGNSPEAPKGGVEEEPPLLPNGLTIRGYCTDIAAYLISCTGIPNTGEGSHTLWVRIPGSDEVESYPISVTGVESSEETYEFSGHAVCRESGGYALIVTVSPVYAGSWKIEGVNVHIHSSDLLTADTLEAGFNKLPPAGEDIHYQVCMETSSSLTYECVEYSTAQPVCESPATASQVQLIASGCDPDKGNFFTQFSHNLSAPDPSYLAVANDMGAMSCVILEDKGHTIFCASAMSTLIGKIDFTYTEPGNMVASSWNVEVESCPPPAPTCGDFNEWKTCTDHGCSWDGAQCH